MKVIISTVIPGKLAIASATRNPGSLRSSGRWEWRLRLSFIKYKQR